MDQTRLSYLLRQHHLDRCTPAEQAELDTWYDSLDNKNNVLEVVEETPEADAYIEKKYTQFLQKIDRKKRVFQIPGWARVAAVVVVLVAAAVYLYTAVQTGTERSSIQVANVSNRFITLPDSSVVILAEGSKIELLPGFGKGNRNLTLKGEAYFDIKHNASLPFIIQTGKVKTTVLGTAFNIKQTGDSVYVTVTRGKVQVAYEDKILAQLTPGKQFTADQHNRIAQTTEPAVATVTSWMQNGLHFENATLGEAVEELENRFNTPIDLRTPGIENCRMAMTTPFSGTERLETILEVIATTLGAQYSNHNGTIEITGQPCPANLQ